MRWIIRDGLRARQCETDTTGPLVTFGRGDACDVRLQGPLILHRHAQVRQHEDGWVLSDLGGGANPVRLNGEPIAGPATVTPEDRITIAQYSISFEQEDASHDPESEAEEIGKLQVDIHEALLSWLDLREGTQSPRELNPVIDGLLHEEFRPRIFENPQTRRQLLRMAFVVRLAERQMSGSSQRRGRFEAAVANPDLEQKANRAVEALARKLPKQCGAAIPGQPDEQTAPLIDAAADGLVGHVQEYVISQFIKKLLFDTMFGFGPLQDLLELPGVNEIMVVNPELVYVEHEGRMTRVPCTFVNDEVLISVIERIVADLGRRIDRSQPLVDGRLPDRSRVNAIIPPLAVGGACLTLRRFPEKAYRADGLCEAGTLTPIALTLLRAFVGDHNNIIVAGGTGAGKTTILNAMSEFIAERERIVTIEDTAELQLLQEHVVTLETRPASIEGAGEVTARDLVKNALRMRPDRIIVGECRGAEAIDMLQAMNTGHRGSMTTLHANSADDVPSRLETMIRMYASDIPTDTVRQLVSRAVDFIVFVQRVSPSRRMVTQISEVTGVNPKTGEVEINDIMRVVGTGERAVLKATGHMPTALNRLVESGLLNLDEWLHGSAAG
jgi:Flp pilus assembly CpaF family ATPase